MYYSMETKLKPGLNHIEFWVSDVKRSMAFYEGVLTIVGWVKISDNSLSSSSMILYFLEVKGLEKLRSLGVRHLCFQATKKNQVEQVHSILVGMGTEIIRGPQTMPYSEGYYTVDFFDPDGQVIEVAYTPEANTVL
ncbi:catechol 2,3-dioxygenase-like lactoylglutathione lyase family enzyme [Flavobacterium sp. W4I14]|nr:catechol 2,3-dioxygenase-like lactoylglutathione lyase family enzyme [Flavobacterium sp. W4I14]